MAKILFLAHRVPFPPNKGDKIRAFHILEHLSRAHEIWLGACADDADDMRHLAMARSRYAGACFGLTTRLGRSANMALAGFADLPMSVARFRQRGLEQWTRDVLHNVKPDLVYIYSSAMARYVIGCLPPGTGLIVDFVDADAEKWRAYANETRAPRRWIYAREFDSLVRYERAVLDAADAGILVSETERRLQSGFAPDGASKLHVIPNGVDADYFQPVETAAGDAAKIVFTGTMDYLPNIDAVRWFAHDMLPGVRQACPQAVFQIVGAKPTAEVLALAALPGVEVVGAVPDIRPYLFGANVIVAPLRIARGIQNKVLEGMAAGKPVVATPQALDGIDAAVGRDVLVGVNPMDFIGAVTDVLCQRVAPDLGGQARAYILARHRWGEALATLDPMVAKILHARSAQASA
jgi:sugar transferase (PEP-CTERM/EpsH1 system associated)